MGLAGGSNAFDLQQLSARDAAEERTGIVIPLPTLAADKYSGSEIEAAYKDIEREFYAAEPQKNWDIEGDWEGRVFVGDSNTGWRTLSLKVSFKKTVSPADLGPLFPNYSSELLVTFPYYSAKIEQPLVLDGSGLNFKFRADREFLTTFRHFVRGQSRYLSMRTDCYNGISYGYFYKVGASAR
ncbi:MAG: hypothetical protein A2X32_07745 [Elusimicrobia bacterium GWC2_64_44]|nr:MAG: hypothetical protein A2X32_07745 [Elusimicrobia bacterium GWC2_64_44]